MWAQTHESGTRRSSGSRGVLQMDSVRAVILFYVPGQDTLVSKGVSSPRSLNGNSNLPGKADEIYGGGGGGIDCDGPASHAEGGGGVDQDCFKPFAITETGISRGTEGG